MNDLNATIGLYNLEDINKVVKTHQDNGLYYDKVLQNIPGVSLLKRHFDRLSSYWLYTILIDDRKRFMELMQEKGIITSQVHARNDLMTMFKDYYIDLPGVNKFTAKQVSIPVHWDVSKPDREYIVESIKEVQGEK